MPSILLIEDNADLSAMMASALTRAGHAVHRAANGKMGVRLLQSHPVDLLITDLVMPEQDGLETIMLLRQTHPQLRIIAISGDSPRHAPLYLTLAGNFGAMKTLLKPFSADALLAAVNETLG